MTSNPVPSLNNGSSTYEYDDLELDDESEVLPTSGNINDIISPNNPWLDSVFDFGDDSCYAELQATAPNLGQVYKNFGKPGSGLLKYNAGFFWLRLPKPNQGT